MTWLRQRGTVIRRYFKVAEALKYLLIPVPLCLRQVNSSVNSTPKLNLLNLVLNTQAWIWNNIREEADKNSESFPSFRASHKGTKIKTELIIWIKLCASGNVVRKRKFYRMKVMIQNSATKGYPEFHVRP